MFTHIVIIAPGAKLQVLYTCRYAIVLTGRKQGTCTCGTARTDNQLDKCFCLLLSFGWISTAALWAKGKQVDLVLALPQRPSPDIPRTFRRPSSSNFCAPFLQLQLSCPLSWTVLNFSLQSHSEPWTTAVDWKLGAGFQSSGCGYVTRDNNLLNIALISWHNAFKYTLEATINNVVSGLRLAVVFARWVPSILET